MSLSLLQGYSSAEEDADEYAVHVEESSEEETHEPSRRLNSYSSVAEAPRNSGASGLPSALDAFSEVSGPPDFLNNSVQEKPPVVDADQQLWRHGRRRNRKEKKVLPPGVVMEAKAQLVGIQDRVRSDVEGSKKPSMPPPPSQTTTKDGKRVSTAANPSAEDAADLLRMCVKCGIPKTFSNARGMVCPVCGDRPISDTDAELKKKGSTVKDKEKNKRMKGQSSHATWKSETEMQLRQQFD